MLLLVNWLAPILLGFIFHRWASEVLDALRLWAADLKPKKLKLGVDFDLAFDDEQGLSPDSPAIRGMKEAARQLGLDIDVEPET